MNNEMQATILFDITLLLGYTGYIYTLLSYVKVEKYIFYVLPRLCHATNNF